MNDEASLSRRGWACGLPRTQTLACVPAHPTGTAPFTNGSPRDDDLTVPRHAPSPLFLHRTMPRGPVHANSQATEVCFPTPGTEIGTSCPGALTWQTRGHQTRGQLVALPSAQSPCAEQLLWPAPTSPSCSFLGSFSVGSMSYQPSFSPKVLNKNL
jgi:hypothetical protein